MAARPVLATGYDYSDGHPTAAHLLAAKPSAQFVIRYIDDAGHPGPKHISKTEYADLTKHGIRVYLVCERTTNDWMGGRNAGRVFARAARAGADAIGYPAGGLIFFCADMHLTPAQIPTGLQFVTGAADVLGHDATGGYGFSEFIGALAEAKVCRGLWQAGSRSVLHPGAHFYQCNDRPNVVIDKVKCDIDEQYLPLEVPMPITDNDAAVFWNHDVRAGEAKEAAWHALSDARAQAVAARDHAAAAKTVAQSTAAAVAALGSKIDGLAKRMDQLAGDLKHPL